MNIDNLIIIIVILHEETTGRFYHFL